MKENGIKITSNWQSKLSSYKLQNISTNQKNNWQFIVIDPHPPRKQEKAKTNFFPSYKKRWEKVYKRGFSDCKDQPLINKMIIEIY